MTKPVFAKQLMARTLSLLATGLCLSVPALAGPQLPSNLGLGLRELAQSYLSAPETFRTLRSEKRLQVKDESKVLVTIYPNGRLPLAKVQQALERLGVEIVAVNDRYRAGAISAWLPLSKAAEAGLLEGVSAIQMERKPVSFIGATTAQGVVVHKTDQLNSQGVTGTGISIGILSDSYDRNTTAATTAAEDVLTGDLPGPGNPFGNTTPVFVLQDSSGSDEGRGMAQIVHDVAPGAKLCFATANGGPPAFANNIRSLRTNPSCNADVIVDDIIYLNEPMFSDGQIALAVEDVVTSTTLAGKRVSYFSSAGNRGQNGYASDFRLVSNTTARNQIDPADGTINLRSIPTSINTQGGFHDFDPGPGVDISQTVRIEGDTGTLVFQWDDPFDVVGGGVTTDYNIIIFDSRGRYVGNRSGVANNFSTNQPLEIPAADLANGATYRIVIAKSSATRAPGVAQQATRLRYVIFTNGAVTLDFALSPPNAYVTTYGHNSALNGNGVAAYIYDSDFGSSPTFTPTLEDFSSPGPVTIAFDAAGNRLATAQVRNKPDIAAADGVNTTMFPPGALADTDIEGDGFPNFFGTSAAAPHAAGIAALLLQKAGGPNTITPANLKAALQNTAPARDVDPFFSTAVAGPFTISGVGFVSTDANFFRTSLGSTGLTLNTLTLNATGAGLVFDPSASGGFPLTTGTTTGSTPPTITSPSPTAPSATLALSFNSYNSGDTLNFGIDRDLATGGFGNSADELAGTTVSIVTSSGSFTGTFVNNVGTGYSIFDGFGLIDAAAAASLFS